MHWHVGSPPDDRNEERPQPAAEVGLIVSYEDADEFHAQSS
jgi:hypothetical protein